MDVVMKNVIKPIFNAIHSAFTFLGSLVIIFIIATLIITTGFSLDKRPTIGNIKQTQITIPFIDGDILEYRFEADILRNCKVTLRRTIEQFGVTIELIPKPFPRYIDTKFPFHADWNIPIDLRGAKRQLQTGTATYKVRSTAYCNVAQEWFNTPIIEVYPEFDFEVIK